jgi:hypothetical protein
LFVRDSDRALIVVHIDDIMLVCAAGVREQLETDLRSIVTLKPGNLIADEWVKYLGLEWRRVSRTEFHVRPLEKSVTKALQLLTMENSKPLRAMTSMTATAAEESKAEPLDGLMHHRYRSVVGLLLWLGHVRCDLCFAVKELARAAAHPTTCDLQRMKKVLRYLSGSREVYIKLFGEVLEPGASPAVSCYSDASWATGLDKKSTSGGCIYVQNVLFLQWSRTQTTVSMSSCEAELCGLWTAGQETQYVKTLLEELGFKPSCCIFTDSASALALARRRGLGRQRHLALRLLWLQDAEAKGICLRFIEGSLNCADLMTKFLARQEIARLCYMMHLVGLE